MSYNKVRLMLKYPTIADLAKRAKKRLPEVAWAYLSTGTGQEYLLEHNENAFKGLRLVPQFLKGQLTPQTETTIFGQTYAAPFGIAPVGLTGLMWPKAEVLLAKSAAKYQIPFSLSTVATETPETLAPHIENIGWFQLYPPREKDLRRQLLERAWQSGFRTLLVTADVPTPSRRERTKRAGLSMPPKIRPSFIWQALTHPTWTYYTLQNGLPRLRTIEAYSNFKDMMSVTAVVQDRIGGNLGWDYCRELRDEWQGPIVIKGILHPKDAEQAISIGMDGIVVSNHGGRQFDGAPASIEALPDIVKVAKNKTIILLDSGVRCGLDILKALHLGADFVLLGRAFLYGVGALGQYGGDHVIEILLDELKNNMVQLGIEKL